MNGWTFTTLIAAAAAFGAGAVAGRIDTTPFFSAVGSSKSCDIKGNISFETGERIYHLPWQEYYSKTAISRDQGERWFCTESDARAAGWRRSKV